MNPPTVAIHPLGDRAVLVDLGGTVDDDTRRRVHALWSVLRAEPVAGVIDIVPGLASVAVHYEPTLVRCAAGELPHLAVSRIVAERAGTVRFGREIEGRTIEIAVCYDEPVAPDLVVVARHAGMTTDEVVALHSAGEYVVHMIGFLPGFPYLAGLDSRLAIPRRPVPRVRVPAGSVAIGGSLTGVYPLDSPGGWHLIGRTAAMMFSPERAEPTLLRIGDRVRFRQVSLAELGSEAQG